MYIYAHIYVNSGAGGEITLQAKVLATKPDNLSLTF